jgi:hypothetical protein
MTTMDYKHKDEKPTHKVEKMAVREIAEILGKLWSCKAELGLRVPVFRLLLLL